MPRDTHKPQANIFDLAFLALKPKAILPGRWYLPFFKAFIAIILTISVAPFHLRVLAQTINPKTTLPSNHSTSTVSSYPPPAPPLKVDSSPTKPSSSGDVYPLLDQLETITFGLSKPNLPLEERLTELENTVFQQSFSNQDLESRASKLEKILLGTTSRPEVKQQSEQPKAQEAALPENHFASDFNDEQDALKPEPPADPPLWHEPAYQVKLPESELVHFALQLVNEERGQLGLNPLIWDELLAKMATQQIDDLVKRNTVSHLNSRGENPDKRYTELGGTDALTEGLVTLKGALATKANRHMVAKVIQTLKEHQDDRDALLSPDATGFAVNFGLIPGQDHLLAITEVVTKHAIMHPLPKEIKVGQKIELKGVVLKPYKFQRITIAWEGLNNDTNYLAEATDEPMPYFPPLDFVAYGQKSEHDWEKGKAILRTAGVLAAIAGGMFIPPVALAAPLIAMSGTSSEIKAAQDIPIRGGIKVNGSVFSGSIPVDNSGKSGMYYVTVWAAPTMDARPVPISRRTIVAIAEKDGATNNETKRQKKKEVAKEAKLNAQ